MRQGHHDPGAPARNQKHTAAIKALKDRRTIFAVGSPFGSR